MENSTLATNTTTTNVTVAPLSTTKNPYSNLDPARYIYFYGLAVILPVGLLCNLLCFAVFLSSRSLRRTTTGHYLTALAVADTIFLTGELFRWLNSFDSNGQILGIDFMETITFWCRTTFFLRYAGKLASAWITVVISAERFITVAYPLRVARVSTPKTARCTIAGIFIVCSALGSYPFWTIGLIEYGNSTFCGFTDEEGYENWSMAILRVGSLFLPSAIIVVYTVLILVHLRKAKKVRLAQLEGQGLDAKKSSASSSVDFQLTVMLVSVACAFIVLRLPYTVSYYLNEYKEEIWNPLDPKLNYEIYVANKVCDMIAIVNYAVNFFLYCLCGSSFRLHAIALLSCKKTRKGVYTSTSTMSSKYSVSTSSQKKHFAAAV